MVSITFMVNFYYIYGWYYIYGFYCIYGDTTDTCLSTQSRVIGRLFMCNVLSQQKLPPHWRPYSFHHFLHSGVFITAVCHFNDVKIT